MKIGWAAIAATACAFAQVRPADIVKLPSRPADARESYGPAPQQFGELRLAKGDGPHPLAILIHGGCWAEYADFTFFSNFATRLADDGIATWNVEYRRVHEPGGGWPGTMQDTGAAVDYAAALAKRHPLDMRRVVVAGHSAGGQLALWAAGRSRIPSGSPLHISRPLAVSAAVSIAGPPDMEAMLDHGRKVCGDRHIKLFGGTPEEVGDRYKAGSPHALVPLAAKQYLIYGARDRAVPRSLFGAYETDARHGTAKPRVTEIETAGHFEMFVPGSPGAEVVRKVMLEAVSAGGR